MGSISSSFGSGYFISASGLMEASLRLDAASHNVANSNTSGFIPTQMTSVAQSTGGVSGVVVLGNRGHASNYDHPVSNRLRHGRHQSIAG